MPTPSVSAASPAPRYPLRSRLSSPVAQSARRWRIQLEVLAISDTDARRGLSDVFCILSVGGRNVSFFSERCELIGDSAVFHFCTDHSVLKIAPLSKSCIVRLVVYANEETGEFVGEATHVLPSYNGGGLRLSVTRGGRDVGVVTLTVFGDFEEQGVEDFCDDLASEASSVASRAPARRGRTVCAARPTAFADLPADRTHLPSVSPAAETGSACDDGSGVATAGPSCQPNGHLLLAALALAIFLLGVSVGFLPFVLDTPVSVAEDAQDRLFPQSLSAIVCGAAYRAANVVRAKLYPQDHLAAPSTPPIPPSDDAIVVDESAGLLLLSPAMPTYGQWRSAEGGCLAYAPGAFRLPGSAVLMDCGLPDTWWRVVAHAEGVRLQSVASQKCLHVQKATAKHSALVLYSCTGSLWAFDAGQLALSQGASESGLVVRDDGERQLVSWSQDVHALPLRTRRLEFVLSVQAVAAVQSSPRVHQWHPEVREFHSISVLAENSLIVVDSLLRV